jgi:methanogenic corrinoid protein MtbC1
MNGQLQTSHDLEQSLLTMNRIKAEEIITRCGTEMKPLDIVEQIIAPAMERIGVGWEVGSVALSQVYMSSRICENLVAANFTPSKPLRTPQPIMGIAVLEDYHLLGKRIILSVLSAAGYEVEDLGQGDVEGIADKVQQQQIQLLFISTLMLRSALRVKALREELAKRELQVKIVVGGAPFRFDPELWQEVGADMTATGASQLIPVIAQLVQEMV